MCIYIYIGKGGGHRSVSRARKAYLLLIACDAIDGVEGWERDRRGKKSLSLLLKPSSCAVRGSEMSDCTAGLLVFRECFAAFRDLILHCLRRRAASRCHRYFPPLCLVHPHSFLPESEGEGMRIAGQEGKTKHTKKNPSKN